ncbi:putative ion transporter superfamily protein YfcC [Streptosporangium becharense]|uniref:Putative ion transporter superfamily protein YfcC n=1 Tax=Streptosporangium becharense TaxID=1816182 RepID=A0A7W9IGQ0_9ACTN|nr:hypothetical protein [Streptosporangium becharense]MBB2909193.1 putative ion transporter superfamily protein YfcC [Streptosporangium becharense]MBB5819788.1 putative ion transporter superfamily protein YfcC [Streptosporangium becharense]
MRPDRPAFWVTVAALSLPMVIFGLPTVGWDEPVGAWLVAALGVAAMFAAVATAHREAARLRARRDAPEPGDVRPPHDR